MQEEIVFLFLLGLIFFFVWNSDSKPKSAPVSQQAVAAASSPTYDGTAVPLEVVQAVIEKFQSTQEDMVPLETLFFTPIGDGLYKARLMFMNTRHFFGQQFDINASIDDSGKVTILHTESTTDPVSYATAYQPDSYQSFNNVTSSLKSQLQTALTASKEASFPIQLADSFSSVQSRASTGIEKMNP
jgi:hypothetical protein